jgi:hypothetical protein
MMIDADFSLRRESKQPTPARDGERDDHHLRKPAGLLADVVFLEELTSVIKEAQQRDAEDESRLYSPLLSARLFPARARRLPSRLTSLGKH